MQSRKWPLCRTRSALKSAQSKILLKRYLCGANFTMEYKTPKEIYSGTRLKMPPLRLAFPKKVWTTTFCSCVSGRSLDLISRSTRTTKWAPCVPSSKTKRASRRRKKSKRRGLRAALRARRAGRPRKAGRRTRRRTTMRRMMMAISTMMKTWTRMKSE
jgi:hypothetical protein